MARERERIPTETVNEPVAEAATEKPEHCPATAGKGGRFVLDEHGNRIRVKE